MNLATIEPPSLQVSNAGNSRKVSVERPPLLEPRPRLRRRANVPPLASHLGMVYEPLPVLDLSTKANKSERISYRINENLDEKDREEERRKIEDCLKRMLLRKRLKK